MRVSRLCVVALTEMQVSEGLVVAGGLKVGDEVSGLTV